MKIIFLLIEFQVLITTTVAFVQRSKIRSTFNLELPLIKQTLQKEREREREREREKKTKRKGGQAEAS